MSDLKYALIGDSVAVEDTKTKKDCLKTGLWGWSRAFDQYGDKGDVRLIRRKEDLEKYDIIHVNITGGNWGLINHIAEELKDSSTIMMANIDFTVANWDVLAYFSMIKKQFEHVDIPFHVEPVGADALAHILGKKVHTLPHPCDIECLAKHRTNDRHEYITLIHHRYLHMVNSLWIATQDIPYNRVLLGYQPVGNVPTLSIMDQTYPMLPFMEAIDIMAEGALGLDLFPLPVAGRVVVDFAALAIPCVCSSEIEAGRRLFPDLCVHPFALKEANEKIKELSRDGALYSDSFTNAFYDVKYYGYKACHDRLVEVYEEVKK